MIRSNSATMDQSGKEACVRAKHRPSGRPEHAQVMGLCARRSSLTSASSAPLDKEHPHQPTFAERVAEDPEGEKRNEHQ
jgi:hypothetical protein